MRCLSLMLFLLMTGQVCADAVSLETASQHPLAIHRHSDLNEIRALDQEVDDLLVKIEQCQVAELAPRGQCHCQYPGRLNAVRHAINQILEKHPEWRNRALLWWDRREVYASSLHLGGLQRQLDQPCEVLVTTIRGPESS